MTNQGFLLIHRVNLWFVFVFAVCSVSILNHKLVRHPDGTTSHRFKVVPALRNESAKHEFVGVQYTGEPIMMVHQYAAVDDLVEEL